MDLGLAFDDDDLIINEKKTRDDMDLPYNVKIYSPQWFDVVLESHVEGLSSSELDPEQIPHTFKFSGDFHYHQGNYEKAIAQYTSALGILPESNSSVRQDMKESLSRCYMHVGQPERCLKLARELVAEMTTEDVAHQRQSLILLSSVCEKVGRWAECIDSLEKLCTLQPTYAPFWNQLGDAYAHSYHVFENADDVRERNCGDASSCVQHCIKSLTCYVRASLLLQATLSIANNMVNTRNQALMSQLSKKIDSIPFPHRGKKLAFESIQEELENQAQDSKDLSLDRDVDLPSVVSTRERPDLPSQLFYHRFCSWYLKSCAQDTT